MHKVLGKAFGWAQKQAKVAGYTLGGVVFGAAGAALVSATIPDANGVIHGCIRNNGDLRIIDTATQSCTSAQDPISFNQTGPQGPAGPAGPSGSGGVLINNLVGADLRGAVMVGWDLSGKDFSNADMTSVRLTGSKLTGTNFSGAILEQAALEGTNFTGINLSGAHFMGTGFADGNFTGANFSGAQFNSNNGGGNFTNANFTGAVLKVSWTPHIANPNFSGANFTNASFTPDDSYGGVFDHVNFSNATFTGVSFNSTPVLGRQLDFRTVNFTGTDLSGINMTDVIWRNTTCPDGTNSDDNGETCVGHLVP
jgi:uncharacterized protein YjbI with pentapeptide repeats